MILTPRQQLLFFFYFIVCNKAPSLLVGSGIISSFLFKNTERINGKNSLFSNYRETKWDKYGKSYFKQYQNDGIILRPVPTTITVILQTPNNNHNGHISTSVSPLNRARIGALSVPIAGILFVYWADGLMHLASHVPVGNHTNNNNTTNNIIITNNNTITQL